MPERKYPYGIDPGDLPHMITLQKPNPVEQRDEVGAPIADFVDVDTVHAKVSPISGKEEFLAAQRQSSTTHSVIMHWSPKNSVADGSWRIKFKNRLLLLDRDPENVEERNVWMIMRCTEGRRNG